MTFDEAFATVSKHRNVYMALPKWEKMLKFSVNSQIKIVK